MESRAAVQGMLDECGDFQSAPLTDFSLPDNVQAFEKALERVRGRLEEEHPLIIGGEEVWTDERFNSVYPAHPVGIFSQGANALAERAVDAAGQAFETWSRTPSTERGAVLLKAAEIMRARRRSPSASSYPRRLSEAWGHG
jgi:1-pyrroline-5-carboxylate dehydrogenase